MRPGRNGPIMEHPLYNVWNNMKSRCRSGYATGYKYYGGRGIQVCQEWKHFWTFAFDMGKRPSPRHTIDRIDNSGPYAPWNCRWATWVEQMRNRRPGNKGARK